jgi:UDP-glucose 4-epimerase
MRVLITGAGLIGCHAAKRLIDAGDTVILYDLAPNQEYIGKVCGKGAVEVIAADMRDLPALIGALKSYGAETIVHTAGLIGRRVAENPYTGATNNILATTHALEAARLLGLKRVIFVSTFGVYDRAKILRRAINEDAPIGGHNLYTVTKVCSEHLLHAYTEIYKLDTVIIRPAGVFGRGLYVGGSTVGMVMRDLALNMARGGRITLDRKVYFANEYVYAKDVAHALELACKVQAPRRRIYNVGTGVVTGVEDLAAIIGEVAPELQVSVVGDRNEESGKTLPLDLQTAQSELGYSPLFSLRKALQDYTEELKRQP